MVRTKSRQFRLCLVLSKNLRNKDKKRAIISNKITEETNKTLRNMTEEKLIIMMTNRTSKVKKENGKPMMKIKIILKIYAISFKTLILTILKMLKISRKR